jgi:DNA-binding beta-propeller fold protein YncE
VRRPVVLGLVVGAAACGAVALGQDSPDQGRIGPANKVQPSGRKLEPFGKRTRLGNHPGGGALTKNGRFYWTLSAGRGLNDIRIVQVASRRCKRPRRPRRTARVRGRALRRARARYRRRLRAYRRCKRRRSRRIGRVVQVIPMPGVNGGIAMAPDGRTAYVSGTPDSTRDDLKSPEGTPGKEGDVVHVFHYDPKRGRASRAGTISIPPPEGAPIPQVAPLGLPDVSSPPQNFPPTRTEPMAWPRDLAVSRDGKTMLAALNLADSAAIVDLSSNRVRYVRTGSYPYGAAITRDGKLGLVSNESDGTVSVIDLADARKVKDLQVGPHLSHPEAIAVDPRTKRAYVAVTHQDLIAVVDTDRLQVERTLSVERPEGIGTAPVDVSVTRDGCFLLSADSGEDAVAVFALPNARGVTCSNQAKKKKKSKARRRRKGSGRSRGRSAVDPDALLQRAARRGLELSESAEEEAAELYGEESEERAEAAKRKRPARRRSRAFELVGRVPVGSYPVNAEATPARKTLVWLAAKGIGVGGNPGGPGRPGGATPGDDRGDTSQRLPYMVSGQSGIARFPTDRGLRRLTPRASRQIRPINGQQPPPGTPIRGGGPIEHVFYVVRENRTYDQVLGDDARGDGDPKLTLFPEHITPNAHALAKRFPLLDHVYANSEASIDGHFWTSAGNVSDYVVKNWHQNYGERGRPYDFGVYAVTWPSQRFLFDQAERQGISYFNYGEAVAGVVPLPDKDRNEQETEEVNRKLRKSDLGPPEGCFPNDASAGGVDEILQKQVEVFDSSLPPGAAPNSESRFECFRARFLSQVVSGSVPAFNYVTLSNDHTAGTMPGRRTPNAMMAENDWALGQLVDLISHSPIWSKSLILVIEDDSQDGSDHVDAHRIPALAISPYAKRGAVVHTRYDFLSFIRTLEIVVGMKPLNLFDALAVPMYDAFDADPGNAEPYNVLPPNVNLTERNTASSTNARFSDRLPLERTDRTPQRYLDRILWQYVHGPRSEPPPPGPNAVGLDETRWRRAGKPTPP